VIWIQEFFEGFFIIAR